MAKKQAKRTAQKTKNQHYVPQSYLRRFANHNEVIYVFDKFQQKAFTSKVKNIAIEGYFYDFPDLGEHTPKGIDTQLPEKTLAVLEGQFEPHINKVLASLHAERKLNPQHKELLALFIAIQFLRTKEFRETQTAMYVQLRNKVADMFLQDNYPELKAEYKLHKGEDVVNHVQRIFNEDMIKGFVFILQQHIWLVGINTSEHLLYTSDNPVVRMAHNHHPFLGTSGIASEGIEIAVPLNPHHVLILRERTFFKDIQERLYRFRS